MAHRGVFVFSPQISFILLLPCSLPLSTLTTLSTVLARARPGRWLLRPRCMLGPQSSLPQRCCTGLRRSSPCGLCKSRLPPTLFPLDCNDGLPRRLDGDESRSLRGFQMACSGVCAPGSHSVRPHHRWSPSLCRNCWGLHHSHSTACGFLFDVLCLFLDACC